MFYIFVPQFIDHLQMYSISIHQYNKDNPLSRINAPFYFVLIFEGNLSFSIDFVKYESSGKNLIFLSPYQILECHNFTGKNIEVVQFHGDFYCIEYHKKEVACNGILFNNIYQKPFINIDNQMYTEIASICEKIKKIRDLDNNYDISIAKTYLQLILALSSKAKFLQSNEIIENYHFKDITSFQNLLEKYFLENREVNFYAEKMGLSLNSFSKKIKKQFGKSPSRLIQERIVLEAKKLIHLTQKSIKEIAQELNFEDEFYFSRYFKKGVGVSPKKFREEVGISIVAK